MHVYQMIAENTVESKVCLNVDLCAPGRSRFTEIVPGFQVMDIQEKKKKLIKEVSIWSSIVQFVPACLIPNSSCCRLSRV